MECWKRSKCYEISLREERGKPLTVATEEVGIKVLSKMASRCVGSEYSLKY